MRVFILWAAECHSRLFLGGIRTLRPKADQEIERGRSITRLNTARLTRRTLSGALRIVYPQRFYFHWNY